jgi:hypothetical protein
VQHVSFLQETLIFASRTRAVPRRAIALVAFALTTGLLTGCASSGGPPQQPSVNLAKLPGTWVSGDGASITFTAGDEFRATNFNYRRVMGWCRTLSGSGTWQLVTNSDEYPVPPAGTPENLLDLWFSSVSPPGSCLGVFTLTTWNTGSTLGLCLEMDPDDPCDGYIFTKR